MSAKHEFDPKVELFHFDFLKQDQLAFLRKTTHLTGNELQLMAYKQALIIFNTLTFPQNVKSMQHEEDRRDEVLGAWEIRSGTAYAEGFSTIEQVYENTRLYNPELYNAAEAKTVIAGFHLLAQGKAQEIHYPMFHPDSTRYIVGLRRVGDTIVNISVDVGKFGRDLTHTEGADVVRLLGQKDGTLLHIESDFPLLVVDKQLTTTQIQQTALSRSLVSDVDQTRKRISVFQLNHGEIGQTSISASASTVQLEQTHQARREGRAELNTHQPQIESARQPQSIVAKVAAETAHGFMQAYTWLREARQENNKKRVEDSTVVYAETSVRVTRLTEKPRLREKISTTVKRAKDNVTFFISAIQKTKDTLFPQLNKTRKVETTTLNEKINEKPLTHETSVRKLFSDVGEWIRKPLSKKKVHESQLLFHQSEKQIFHVAKERTKHKEKAQFGERIIEAQVSEFATKVMQLPIKLKESVKRAHTKIQETVQTHVFSRVEFLVMRLIMRIGKTSERKPVVKRKDSARIQTFFDRGIKRLTTAFSLMNRDLRLTTFNKVKHGEKPKKAVVKKEFPPFHSALFIIKKPAELISQIITRIHLAINVNKQDVPPLPPQKVVETKRNASEKSVQFWLLVWLWFLNAFIIRFERPVWFFKPAQRKKNKQGLVYDRCHGEKKGTIIVGSASPVVS